MRKDFKLPSPFGNSAENATSELVITDIIGIGTNNTTGNNTNSITLTLGSAFSGETYTDQAMLFNSPGIVSIPVGPGNVSNGNIELANTSPVAAQAIAYVRNDQWTVIGTRDIRTQDRPGNASPGDTVVYGQQGQGRVMCKGNGSVTLYTTKDNTPSGTGMFFSVSPNGSIQGGPAFIMQADFGRFVFDGTGVHFITATGASFDLGGMSPAGPLSAVLGTYCTIGAANINLNASTTTSSAVAGAPVTDAAVLSTPLFTALSALLVEITACFTAVAAFTGVGTFPGLPAAISALTATAATYAPQGPVQKLVASSTLQGAVI